MTYSSHRYHRLVCPDRRQTREKRADIEDKEVHHQNLVASLVFVAKVNRVLKQSKTALYHSWQPSCTVHELCQKTCWVAGHKHQLH